MISIGAIQRYSEGMINYSLNIRDPVRGDFWLIESQSGDSQYQHIELLNNIPLFQRVISVGHCDESGKREGNTKTN